MIEELGALANEIASLQRFAADMQDAMARGITEQIAQSLATAFDTLVETRGTLQGEMPWWRDFAGRRPPASRPN